MIFERSLKKPISNWNISKDKFIFQEYAKSPIIYIVKLYLDREPHLYKFNLPDEVTKKGTNSYFDETQKRFIVP